jgi:hypothetical protein
LHYPHLSGGTSQSFFELDSEICSSAFIVLDAIVKPRKSFVIVHEYRCTISADEEEEDVLVLASRSKGVGIVNDVAFAHEKLSIHVPWMCYFFKLFDSPYLH